MTTYKLSCTDCGATTEASQNSTVHPDEHLKEQLDCDCDAAVEAKPTAGGPINVVP